MAIPNKCVDIHLAKVANPDELAKWSEVQFRSDDGTYYVISTENYNRFYDFDCSGDEVLVESSSQETSSIGQMAARIATPAQGAGSPNSTVRELIVINPELRDTIHLQNAIQQVVEVNGDSSGHSSPNTDGGHTYITVAMQDAWDNANQIVKVEMGSGDESEGNAYHVQSVQYVEQQEMYTGEHSQQIETLRSYPVYDVTEVSTTATTDPVNNTEQDPNWSENGGEEYSYNMGGEEGDSGGQHQTTRMSPATVQWLQQNYEQADGVSLPRSTLYSHYLRHCSTHRLDPVNAASFGKLIRSVFIGLRTRRLGTRGNSKYHYYGIRAKADVAAESPPRSDPEERAASPVVQQPEPKADESPEGDVSPHSQFLGRVTPPDPPPLILPECVANAHTIAALVKHHKKFGKDFLEAVALLDTAAVEAARQAFCRRPPRDMSKKDLQRLFRNKEVSKWLGKADLQLNQKAVELLLPDVLRPQPPQLTQSIRNFAKGLEAALCGGPGVAECAGAGSRRAGAALAGALRRYTSLNHLAQAARAVLNNKHQIHQMLADLNRVDFRVVHEQAAWACSCGSAATAAKLEADFKATLGRGASLEQWARWLEHYVSSALAPLAGAPPADFSARARRLLLEWSFYCSLVIRELTLRSAASFGSFHLLRLLYDEYVAHVVERALARHARVPPIAVVTLHADSDQMNDSVEEDDEGVDENLAPADNDPDWEWCDDEDSPPDAKRKVEE